jgi:hypothetical protein
MQAKAACQVLVIIVALAVSLQAVPQYDHEIVVIVKEGTIQMPLGATTAAQQNDICFFS